MVVFAGESVTFGEGAGPDPGWIWLRMLADMGGPARLIEPVVKWSFGINAKAVFQATIQRACQIAMAEPRGPAFVSVPMEFLLDAMSNSAPAAAGIPFAASADSLGIEQLALLLAAAKEPMIVTENCGRSSGAVVRLIEIAELLGAPVVETRTPGYVNFPRAHPLHAGFDTEQVLKDADLVFMLDAVAPWHPASGALRPATKVAVLAEDPLRVDVPFWGYRVDLCVTGALEASLGMLLECLKKRVEREDARRIASAERWGKRHVERVRAWKDEALACGQKKPIDTRWVAHELNQVLPPGAIVIDETITHRPVILRQLDRLAPGTPFAGHCGGLGTGLGTALGVKAGFPARPVIALIGDGTFNYNPVTAAVGFAQEYGMPILIVIFNNHGYLSQKRGIPEYFPQGWAVKSKTFVGTSIVPSPDYAAIARAFDGYGEKVEDPAEVRPSLERGFKAIAEGRLALLDMRLEAVN
jgi:acetolactate synthase-1/2/3 large subunit